MNFFGDPVFSQKINQRSNIPWEKIVFGCLMIALFTLTYSVAAEAQVTFVGNGQQLNNFVGRGVALADFNGDGALDAFVVNESGQNSQYKVYFGDGKGQFADNGQRLERPIGAAKPVVYDIDGDGSKDVITGRTVWLNDGHGHFSPDAARFTDTDDANFWQCRLADLNGDGRLDIFLACIGPDEVWLNDGQGNFSDSKLRMGADWSWEVAVGDVNKDGLPDLFVVNLGVDRTAPPEKMMKGRFAEVWLNTSPKKRP